MRERRVEKKGGWKLPSVQTTRSESRTTSDMQGVRWQLYLIALDFISSSPWFEVDTFDRNCAGRPTLFQRPRQWMRVVGIEDKNGPDTFPSLHLADSAWRWSLLADQTISHIQLCIFETILSSSIVVFPDMMSLAALQVCCCECFLLPPLELKRAHGF